MHRLTLVRHAKSSWNHPGLRDHDRPLNDRGRRDGPVMAAWCASNLPAPSLWLISSAHRAQRTATMLAEGYGGVPRSLCTEPDLYGAGPGTFRAVLAQHGQHQEHILMVGHNPGISMFASELAPDAGIDYLPTLGIVHFHLDASDWGDLSPDRAHLQFLVSPKVLR